MENNFYQRLRYLSELAQKSLNQIERELGYPRNALNNYKQTHHEPSATRLVELANYFGVTPEYMLGEGAMFRRVSSLSVFNSLSIEEKKAMCVLCYDWLSTFEQVK